MRSDERIAVFRAHVLDHWEAKGRHALPWRQTRDPYAILVSEMMLQQTQVDRVIPYFERWMRTFPSVSKLATAPLEDVLKVWSGLGYNRRAKFVHDSARVVMTRFGGTLPRDYVSLRELPGVGDYTAKAVRVFAFEEAEVLIETNIRSVFIHHFFARSRVSIDDSRLLPLIADALDTEKPREWYSALMDYGTHLKSTHPNPSRKSRQHTKQSRFAGSVRQVRGEILKAVVARRGLASVRERFPDGFEDAHAALVREGLIAAPAN